VGSGPLPLTSIILATNHLRTTCFHNFDIDPSANAKAIQHGFIRFRIVKTNVLPHCRYYECVEQLKTI
jgi:hypothetical protein